MMAVEAHQLVMQLVVQLRHNMTGARRALDHAVRIVEALEDLDREDEERPPRRPTMVLLRRMASAGA